MAPERASLTLNERLKRMQCPTCTGDTKVNRSRTFAHGRLVLRNRVCLVDSSHQFQTREVEAGLTWGQVLVRQFSGRLVPVHTEMLKRDIRVGVMRRMSADQVSVLVKEMLRSMELDLPELTTPLTDAEKAQNPGKLVAIPDVHIGRAVARRLLSNRDKMEYVLYSMSILGREDRGHPQPLRDSTDILTWLYRSEHFPALVTDIPKPLPRPVRVWSPQAALAIPHTVVKRKTSPEPFNRDQFIASIRRGMIGRQSAGARAQYLAEWVLNRLDGQATVHSHQLAIGVLDALRGHDDIAYLRWAVICKRIDSIAAFRDETLNLLTHPSPELRFERTSYDALNLPEAVPDYAPTTALPSSHTAGPGARQAGNRIGPG